jgi:dUTP pyrophosphatase
MSETALDAPCFLICAEEPAQGLYADVPVPGGPRGDSGIDLRFAKDGAIPPGWKATVVDLEVRARCLAGAGFVPYTVMPRSSISKTPLMLANSVGLIDAGYQGTIRVAVRNMSPEDWPVRRGEALFQLVAPSLAPPAANVVGATHEAFATPTRRAEGSFGSTGK